jgi:predicted enzyme related to lactoylglutathione lyase
MNGQPYPVVHFEIIGADAPALREFYAALFGWEFDTSSPVAPEVSDAGQYGFIEPIGPGVAGGVGGGPGRAPHAIFYVGVPDVEAALREAERLGGTRVLGPAANPNGMLVVGHFTDPEGTLVGVAGPR